MFNLQPHHATVAFASAVMSLVAISPIPLFVRTIILAPVLEEYWKALHPTFPLLLMTYETLYRASITPNFDLGFALSTVPNFMHCLNALAPARYRIPIHCLYNLMSNPAFAAHLGPPGTYMSECHVALTIHILTANSIIWWSPLCLQLYTTCRSTREPLRAAPL